MGALGPLGTKSLLRNRKKEQLLLFNTAFLLYMYLSHIQQDLVTLAEHKDWKGGGDK